MTHCPSTIDASPRGRHASGRYNATYENAAPNDKQRWERDTLEPALKKSPSGRSVHDDFRPSDRSAVYRRGRRAARLRARHRRSRRVSRTRAAFTRPAIAASCGRCGSSPASARRRKPTQRYKALLARGRHRPERRLRSADADGPRSRSRAVARRSGEVRRQRRRRSPTWRRCSTASRSATSRRR